MSGLLARAPGVAWLALVWVLLWGTFTPLTVVGGLVVGAGVTAVFRQRRRAERLPLRPVQLLALVGWVLRDLVTSALAVSREALRRRDPGLGAFVAVPLLDAPLPVHTVLAATVTLSPGTMVLRLDRERGRWSLYALGPRDSAGVARVRRSALDAQARVLAALGPAGQVAEARRLRAEEAAR